MLEIIGLDENNNKIKIPLTSDTGSGNPLGTIIAVYSNHVPDGYLPCNGTTFDQTQYPALYTLLGTNVLPDLRNKALMGANPSSQDTPASGNTSNVGDVQKASAPNITGTGPNAPDGFRAGYSGAFKNGGGYTIGYYNAPVNLTTALFDASNSGASSDHLSQNVYGAKEATDTGTELRPANVRVNFCIKATAGITENQADYVGDIIKDYCEKFNSPDWDNAQNFNLSTSDWTAPDDGWLVTTFVMSGSQTELQCNGKRVGTSYNNGYCNFSMKVAKGDVFKLNVSPAWQNSFFVPHK